MLSLTGEQVAAGRKLLTMARPVGIRIVVMRAIGLARPIAQDRKRLAMRVGFARRGGDDPIDALNHHIRFEEEEAHRAVGAGRIHGLAAFGE